MAAEGRTLFLGASQHLPSQRKVGGSQEPVPGLAAADRAVHRITPGLSRDRVITARVQPGHARPPALEGYTIGSG